MKYGLSDQTIRKIHAVLRAYPQVEQAVLYGSRAKGNYKNGSDIDLTLRGEGVTIGVLFRLLEDVDDLLLPYTVDLSIFKDIKDPEVVEHIQRVGVLFYDREEAISEPAATK